MSLPSLMMVWLGLLVMAASSDVTRRRIPNAVVVVLFGVSMAMRVEADGFRGAAGGALAALAVGVPLFVGWRRNLCGAGDVKLAMAAACGVGASRVGSFLLATALAGGVLALALLAGSTSTARREVGANLLSLAWGGSPAVRADSRRRSLPYAVAIGLGAATAILWGR